MIIKSIFIALIFSVNAYAEGLYLDLDAGIILKPDYNLYDDMPINKISNENPVGLIRIGYEYEMGHVYFEHASSLVDAYDPGINIIMIGIRIQ